MKKTKNYHGKSTRYSKNKQRIEPITMRNPISFIFKELSFLELFLGGLLIISLLNLLRD